MRIQAITLLLTLFFFITQQQRISQKTIQNQQKPRMEISNIIPLNSLIYIEINIFNSTHNLFDYTFQTYYSYNLSITLPFSLQQNILQIPLEIFEKMDNITIQTTFYYDNQDIQECIVRPSIKNNITKFKKVIKEDQFITSAKGQYGLHIAQDFNIMIIVATQKFPQKEAFFQQIQFQIINQRLQYISSSKRIIRSNYIPKLDISQLHIPFKYYKSVDGLLAKQNITQTVSSLENNFDFKHVSTKQHILKIHIMSYSLMKYLMFSSMFNQKKLQKMKQINPLLQYVQDQQSLDDMKEILFTNNFYLILVTFLLSFIKIGLQIFAVKNQLAIWNNIQKNKGLSLKILYTDLLFQIVFLLYSQDNQSNKSVLLMCWMGVAVTLWKIKKTFYIQYQNNFPFVKFKHYDWCKHHESIDSQGVRYMYYIMVPMFLLYLIYQTLYADFDKSSIYSFVLQKLFAFLVVAGFIRMTPQLYINYKLKSVDHLPWRTLIYRFFQTIIDDFFVFMVTTPWLHKVMVFREDVIFLLYLYQRKIYKVDESRIGTASGATINRQQFQKLKKQ